MYVLCAGGFENCSYSRQTMGAIVYVYTYTYIVHLGKRSHCAGFRVCPNRYTHVVTTYTLFF